MNMNVNANLNVKANYPSKHVFSKSSIITLAVSLIVLAAAILGRAICAMIYSQRLSVCNSLYQLFGNGSIPVVNLITGIFTAGILVFLAIGIFSSRNGALSQPPVTAGLSFLKMGLIIAIIYTSLAIITSFASVRVINYTDIEGYTGPVNLSATGLVWLTIFFGFSFICCEIAYIRFCNSLKANLTDGSMIKKGPGLAFFAGIIGIITAIVAFFIKLFNLVSPPKDYIQNINADKATQTLSTSDMLLNAFNVIIFAALIVVLISMVMVAASYVVSADDILRTARNASYNATHSVTNPENLQDFSSPNTYNYNQTPTFTPYYINNKLNQDVNKNIYNGESSPIKQAPENPFLPKTQYPAASYTQNPAYQTPPPANTMPAVNMPVQNAAPAPAANPQPSAVQNSAQADQSVDPAKQ